MLYKVSHKVLRIAHHSEKASCLQTSFKMDVIILLNVPFKPS